MSRPADMLPGTLRQIADSAGDEAALTIAMERGGSRLEIPKKAEGSLLETLVGIDAARAIVNDLAGERFDVPLAKRALNAWLRAKGWPQSRRAVALKAGARTIKYWDADAMQSIRQGNLFGADF